MLIDDLIAKLTEVQRKEGNIRVVRELGDTVAFIEAEFVDIVTLDVVKSNRDFTSTIYYPQSHKIAADGKETVVKLD